MSGTSHYDTLGVGPDASQDEIEQAYRRLRKRVHPDAQGSHGLFIQVQSAYETLSDPQRRRAYDAGRSGRSERSAGPDYSRSEPNDRGADHGADHGAWAPPPGPPPPLAPPAALPRMAVAVQYEPPLLVPEAPPPPPPVTVHRVAGWAKISAITISAIGLLMGLLTLVNGLGATGIGGRTVINAVLITVFFLIVAAVPLIISKAIPRRLPQPEPVRPLAAADVLRPEHIERRTFGRPGDGVPVGTAPESQLGRWGAERIAQLLDQTLLAAIPSARLLHGVRAGTVVDHVIVVDNRVLLVESSLRQDGSYLWDHHQLHLDGRPVAGSGLPAAAYELAQVIGGLSQRYVVHGFLLLHSYSPDPTRPDVEYRPLPIRPDPRPGSGTIAVEAGNPEQFLVSAYRFLSEADDPARVDLQLIRALLARTDVD